MLETTTGKGTQNIDPKTLIPHRAPMLLIDVISFLDKEAQVIEARKTVREDEHFIQGHYPEFQLVPGVITTEMIFQTGAALIGALMGSEMDVGDYVPVISRANNLKFKNMILPNDEVHLSVAITEKVGPAYYLKGKATVGGKVAASVEFACVMAPNPSTGTKQN
ncbi:beta-hydroxyacyl-ACP dehydratase [bacterium]|nr:beta-hydroxyacyl-ACP dehydratase [bacterium]